MPTYAYRCTTCEHQFEQSQRFADDPLRDCPVCDGLVRRVIQPVGIVFKGSGWYITDSRKSADAKAESKPDAKADSKGDGKSDGKADAAASAKSDATETKSTDKTSTSTAGSTSGAGAKAAAD